MRCRDASRKRDSLRVAVLGKRFRLRKSSKSSKSSKSRKDTKSLPGAARTQKEPLTKQENKKTSRLQMLCTQSNTQNDFHFLTACRWPSDMDCPENSSQPKESLVEVISALIAVPTLNSSANSESCGQRMDVVHENTNTNENIYDVYEPIRLLTDRSPPTKFQRRIRHDL